MPSQKSTLISTYASVLVAIGVLYLLNEFVYEPYVAPQLENWAEAFIDSRRRARKVLKESAYRQPEVEERRAREQPVSPPPYTERSECEDHSTGVGGQSSLPHLPTAPAELEKDVEKQRLTRAERDLPVPAAPGLRKRTGSRPATTPANFGAVSEGTTYVPLTPTGSIDFAEPRLPPPVSFPSEAQGTSQFPPSPASTPLLSPAMSTVLTPTPPGVLSPVQQPEVYAPLQTIEGLILPLPDEYAMNLVLRSPASSDSGRDATVAAWAEGSPYPSRPDSALSTPRSSLSLPSTAGGDSWTDGDRGSDVLSEELLSLSSRDGFGTDDEEDGAASELGSVSDLGNV